MIHAGISLVDITPAAGLALSGFAARTGVALGAHDRLTVRAVVLGNTALVVCDVLGIDAEMSRRIRQRCCLDAERVVVVALHTHGAPDAMPDRVGGQCSAEFLEAIENGCVQAVGRAAATACPCQLEVGHGAAPGIACNRRHTGGCVDDTLPVLRLIAAADQQVLGVMVSYACHPVVLGPDNLQYTADYPHFVREHLENAWPGCIAVFLTGAAADANSGHTAQDSLNLAPRARRSYAEAQRIGQHIADAVLQVTWHRSARDDVGVVAAPVALSLQRREPAPLSRLVDRWRNQLTSASAAERVLLRHWLQWATHSAVPDSHYGLPIEGPTARIVQLRWGDALFACMPGEIFASTALALRQRLSECNPLFVVAYADDNPGYLVPYEEFAHGGYEVDEAHRYYKLPATFAPGSAERLVSAHVTLFQPTSRRTENNAS